MKREKTIREILENFTYHYENKHYNNEFEKARIEGMLSALKMVLNQED